MIVTAKPADTGVVNHMMMELCRRYPFFRVCPIGCSGLNRPLRGLVMDRGEETVIITAAIHGQEWITALIALKLCEDIAAGFATGSSLFELDVRRACRGRRLIVLPLCNPDGVEIALHGSASAGGLRPSVHRLGGDTPGLWQANARGVDLNHNFPAGWHRLQQMERDAGITGPAPRRFGGPCPASEPETRALIRLCRRVKPRHVVALHTQGEEIYWHYSDRTPTRSRLMAQVMADASGYRAASPTGLASHGGFKDWFILETGRPGFTIELGQGENPLPLSDFDGIYTKAAEMLLLAAFM